MRKIAIVTDSNSGITQDEGRKLGIAVLPMPFYINDVMYLEGITLSQEDFYERLKNDESISTSQPSPAEVCGLWDNLLEEYDEIVHIPMSSGLSASCDTATMLARDYDGRVQVVNNQRISVTQRQSVLDAMTLRDAGKSAAEIKEKLEEEKMESSIYITLETLKYLKKGGRITPAAAAIGTVLNLKPVLQIQGEKLDAYAKVRGKKQAKRVMMKAMQEDWDTRFKKYVESGEMCLQMAYAGNKEEAEEFKKEVQAAFPGIMAEELASAFKKAGYNPEYGKVTVSNRPDLCEFQCNGAMAGAKAYKKAPFMIADDVVEHLKDSQIFAMAEVVKPGFINLQVKEEFLADYLKKMAADEKYSVKTAEKPKTIIIDYGGPNVAKPLHVGHLRSAIIGESIKRIGRFVGHKVIGDVHLGDWGLQMGLIITELKHRKPELVYFDDTYEGEYPKEAPFTISELEEIYPCASGKSKEDEEYRNEALEATHQLQQGKPGYMALWNHIMQVSVTDLKRNYANLNVSFDLWKKESDAQPYIPDMVQKMKDQGFAYEDQGALVVDVKEESDTKEIPPCMLLKSDGASLYTTTDLATIVERVKLFDPDEILYVVDKRQELHFIQVFRCARKTGLVKPETKLSFLGFGTMNGKDGKPFKTREGGVMRLENLIADIDEEMFHKIVENRSVKDQDAKETAEIVGLSAIKYGDLSNQATKDYVFDIDRFTSFEGNTGPYILYTIVRIKSILNRYKEEGGNLEAGEILPAVNASQKNLMLELTKFGSTIENAFEEKAPHKICAYIYEVSNAFNSFYHETKILSEENQAQKESFLKLLGLTKDILETSIDLLGFSAPDRM